MEEFKGKTCPYCKTAVQEGDAVTVCPVCGVAHHAACWAKNGGCTTLGCAAQHDAPQESSPAVRCPTCGAALGEGQSFCPQCGSKVGVAPARNDAIEQFNAAVNKKKRNKKKLLILIPIVILLIAIGVGLFFLLRKIPVKSVTLDSTSVKIEVGDSLLLSAEVLPENAVDQEITWTSSDTQVATVNSAGHVSAMSKGECTITSSASNGVKDVCRVTVVPVNVYLGNWTGYAMLGDTYFTFASLSQYLSWTVSFRSDGSYSMYTYIDGESNTYSGTYTYDEEYVTFGTGAVGWIDDDGDFLFSLDSESFVIFNRD